MVCCDYFSPLPPPILRDTTQFDDVTICIRQRVYAAMLRAMRRYATMQ